MILVGMAMARWRRAPARVNALAPGCPGPFRLGRFVAALSLYFPSFIFINIPGCTFIFACCQFCATGILPVLGHGQDLSR
jgi:hypothetical protein